MTKFYNAFISYGRADSKEFATKLYNCLTSAGFNIWFDQNDIPLGVDFQNQIDDGIAKADNFLFIIAPHSVNSPYCQKEINLAVKYNKRIIPLLHVEQITQEIWQERNPQGTKEDWEAYQAKGLDSSLTNMPPKIGQINWAYFREDADNFDTSFAGLIEVFHSHEDYVRQHTEILAKAREWEQNKKPSRYLLIGQQLQAAEAWLDIRFKEEQAPCQPSDLHCEYICESIKNANNLLTQVFIRYAEGDRAVMKKLTRTLQREKITIWTERSDIKKRMSFQEKLHRGIAIADNFVYLVSLESLTADYCQTEIDLALSYHKRIICFIVPSPEIEALPEFSYESQTNELIKQIKDDELYYHQHKILLVQALKWQDQNHNPSILFRGYNLQYFQAWLKVAETRQDHLPTDLQKEFLKASSQHQAKSLEVFIAYSRRDSDLARKINDALQIQGKTTWFDQESIAAGTDFQHEIYRGIKNSDNFLFIISPDSVFSPYCSDEVEYAEKLNKRFVTILYRPVKSKTLHPALAKVQWIDFTKHQGDFYANFSELVRILDTDRDHVQSHTKWSQRALEWEEKSQSKDLLLRGRELTGAESWLRESEAENKQPPATDLQKEFIAKSRQQNRNNRLLQIGSVAALIILVSGAAIFSGLQWQQAEQQERVDQIKTNASLAESLVDSDPVKALTLAIQVTGRSQKDLGQVLPLVQSSLFAALPVTRKGNLFKGYQYFVNSVAFSPDGRRIVSGSHDGTIRLWDIQSKSELAVFNGHESQVNSVAFSPDGRRIVSGSGNGTIRLWDIQSKSELAVFNGHESWVKSVAFSPPDGQRIVSGSGDKTIRLWDIQSGEQLAVLKGHENLVNSVAFSPDGRRIVSGSGDKTIRLWPGTWQGWLDAGCDELRSNQMFVNAFIKDGEDRQIAHEAVKICEEQVNEYGEPIWNNQEKAELEAKVKSLVVPDLVKQAVELMKDDNAKKALAKYKEAQELDAQLEQANNPNLNNLCRHGSLRGYAAEVMSACDMAVKRDLNNGNIRDSRGVARALTGDYPGAILDFEAYIKDLNQWIRETENEDYRKDYEKKKVQRQGWVDALKKGKNPFTKEVLQELLGK